MSRSLSCSICSENYRSSTSCGHVYHFDCMQEWKSRSSSCPQCRTLNPTSHRIYLTLEDMDAQEEVAALRTQLNGSISLMSALQLKVDESERSFLALHGQYMESEEKVRQLNETIKYQEIQNESRLKENAEKTKEIAELKQMLKRCLKPEQELTLRNEVASLNTDAQEEVATLRTQLNESISLMSALQLKVDESERSFLALHGQYTESEEKVRQLNETIKYQEIQNESRLKENAEKTKEIAELKQMLKRCLKPEQELTLRNEVASLKLRLDNTLKLLDKELRRTGSIRFC